MTSITIVNKYVHAPLAIKKVWILNFEFSGIAKVRSLGETTSLLSSELARRRLEVT